jgi:hypothetical protein
VNAAAMLALAYSAAISGIDAYIVQVQTDSSSGLPHFAIVGLRDPNLTMRSESFNSYETCVACNVWNVAEIAKERDSAAARFE